MCDDLDPANTTARDHTNFLLVPNQSLLLESPCPFVNPSDGVSVVVSAEGTKDKVKRPEGHTTRSHRYFDF